MSGEIMWQNNGLDIFTTIDNHEKDFQITEKYIIAKDWDHRKYQIDFDGNSSIIEI